MISRGLPCTYPLNGPSVKQKDKLHIQDFKACCVRQSSLTLDVLFTESHIKTRSHQLFPNLSTSYVHNLENRIRTNNILKILDSSKL